MKNLYLILLTFVFNITASGQISTAWPDSTAKWINTHYTWNGGPVVQLSGIDNYCLTISDTVVNSVSYRRVYHFTNGYKGAMRSDSGRVFFVPKDSANEYLLYDFTVNEGDTLTNVYMEYGVGGIGLDSLFVGPVDTLMIDSTPFRRISFTGGFALGVWVEGVGNSQGLFRDPYANISGFAIKLECMSRGDTSLYPQYSERPCNLLSIGQIFDTIDVFARVSDSSGNPLSNYLVYVGPGNNPEWDKPLTQLATDQRGVASGKVVPGSYHNLHAYVFNCNGDTVVDHEVAQPYTGTDSTLFDFVIDCPADTCEVVLRHKLVDADSNKYEFYFAETGSSTRLITPVWTFSDGSMQMTTFPPQKIVPAGWFRYCISHGCDGPTCDSLYSMPDCSVDIGLDSLTTLYNGRQGVFILPKLGYGYTYQWDFGDGSTSDSVLPVHTYSQPGTYQLCLQVTYGDDSTSCSDTFCQSINITADQLSVQVVDSNSIGFRKFVLEDFSYYPNPADDMLIIELPAKNRVDWIELWDIQGKMVHKWEAHKSEEQVLNIKEIPSGVYLLRLRGIGLNHSSPLLIR